MNFLVNKLIRKTIINSLEEYGKVYYADKIREISDSVAFHPDMQMHFVSENTAFCEPTLYEYYKAVLPDYIKLMSGKTALKAVYPLNCAYNIAKIGNYVICNTKYADKTILKYYEENNFNIVHINQGYAKCNISVIGKNKIITEDRGIYKAIKDIPYIKTILINHASVLLDGYDYGFIGGATGCVDNKLLLCGKANEELKNELTNNKIDYQELDNEKLEDFGSVLSFG